MNVSQKILALMVALAAGSALGAGTTAGTVISNTASASFTDPFNAANTLITNSNAVTTTVTPVPDFTLTPNDAGTLGQPDQDAPYAPYDKLGVLPGSVQVFQYTVANTGNTPVSVNLSTLNRTDTSVSGVAYYFDSNNNGTYEPGTDVALSDTNADGTVDTGTLAEDASVKILQVYTVPAAATPGQSYGASPVAQGKFDPAYKPGDALPTTTASSPVLNPATGVGILTDNDNFNRVLVYSPTVLARPIDADAPGGTSPAAGGTTNGQTNPAGNAYTDPNPFGTPATVVIVAGGNQEARPPADVETAAPDRVTFINSVTNQGTLSDSFNLLPPAGLPAGVSVTYLDAAGNPLPVVNGYAQVQNVAPGATVNFRVVVTYPDTDGATPPATSIPVVVGIDSDSDSGYGADANTTDTVFPPQLQFGDATAALGASPTPAPDQVVRPGTPGTLQPSANSDSQAIFPMDVANVGGYNEAYTLQGSVVVPLTSGGSQTVAVKYYIDTNNDGAPDTLLPASGGVYTTPVIVAGTELTVWAVVDIPANAAATIANGSNTPLLVSQTATGVSSTIVRTDNNDTVSVAPVGRLVPVKSVDKASAKPGEDLTYTISATNNYNTAVRNFFLREGDGTAGTNIFAFTTFRSVVGTTSGVSGTVLYRFGGGSWQPGNTFAGSPSSVSVGIDTNGNGTIDSGDALPVGGKLNVTLVMRVNN